MTDLLTNSRLKTARACLRRHQLRYVQGYKPAVESSNLRFGTLLHLGLEAWLLAPTDRLVAALAAVQGEADPFDRVRAEALLVGYDTRWGDEDLEVLGVEVQFETDLVNPDSGRPSQTWRLAGKIDAIVRQAGRVMLVEHKTSSEDIRPGSEYWRRLRMDAQVSIYFAGGRALGHDIGGMIYDVIGKPSIKPKKATPVEDRKFTKDGALYKTQRLEDETPEEFRARLIEDIASDPDGYFQRGEVVRLDKEMTDALADVWRVGQAMRDSVRTGRAPRNPDACVSYGRTCEFFDVCTGAASLDDTRQFVKLNTVHPELNTAPESSAA
jgi:hypothetical protein